MHQFVFPSTAVLLVLSSLALTAPTSARWHARAQALVPGTQVPGAPLSPERPPRDPATPPDAGAAIIRGRVVALDTGLPLRRAQVQARSADLRRTRAAFTDDLGHFELRELAPGRYSVSATLTGYLTLQHGQRRPFEQGRPITLADGQVVSEVTFALPPGGVIAGRVVNEYGTPVVNVQVRAERYRYIDGERTLTNVSGGSPMFRGTDDRGEFRIFGLPPGDYYVVADTRIMGFSTTDFASDDRSPGYVSTYYPGTMLPGAAQPITVGLGQEVQGITIALLPSQTATLTGVVLNPQGRPAAGAHLGLMARMGGAGTSSRTLDRSTADGTFSAPGIVPGEYTLHARDGETGATGVTPVVVTGADLAGLVVTLAQPATLRGRITAGDDRPPAGLQTSDVRVMVREVPRVLGFGIVGTAFIDRDWIFEITNMTGTGRLHVQTPSGWALRRILVQGQDVTDRVLDFGRGDVDGIAIELTQNLTTVSGVVTNARGEPERDYVVIVFADDPDRWAAPSRFLATTRADDTGRFELQGLPPGRYLAVAVEYLDEGEETNPARLEALRRASTSSGFTLREGESRALSLRLWDGL